MNNIRKQLVKDLLLFNDTSDTTIIDHLHTDFKDHNQYTLGNRGHFVENLMSRSIYSKRNIKRIFQDGNYVFSHSEFRDDDEYIGFDVFRFQDNQIIEHWDNYQEKEPVNPSGRSMIDGSTEIEEMQNLKLNKLIVRSYIIDVFFNGNSHNITSYFDKNNYIQHNAWLADDVSSVQNVMRKWTERGRTVQYQAIHQILAEGNFVLTISEGHYHYKHTSFYNLFRLENGKIKEHWDNFEPIITSARRLNKYSKF